MLYSQTYWITEQLEHVLEKSSALRWQIAMGHIGIRGKWRQFYRSDLKNEESYASAIWH